MPKSKLTIFLTVLLVALSAIPIANLIAVRFPPPLERLLLVDPYIQIGNNPLRGDTESMSVLWQTREANQYANQNWSIEINTASKWQPIQDITFTLSRPAFIKPSRLYNAKISGLLPGQEFQYRLLQSGKVVFTAKTKAPKAKATKYRFVVFGDATNNSPAQRKVAYQIWQSHPDFAVITGDIVYYHGRLSEYRGKFFPVYNAELASPQTGAPLIRSIPFMPAPGNHDLDVAHTTLARNLDTYPDGLAYFMCWDLPLNGPTKTKGEANTPALIGTPDKQDIFLAESGTHYPVMANYSFDWGNSHWLILDGNNYMDWTNPKLRAWVANDLKSASKATWRFVAYHQPGFSSDRKHFFDQRMRLLSDLFEKYKVDIAFAGHVHNYQRSYPLRFALPKSTNMPLLASGAVPGSFTIDQKFVSAPQIPQGVIYIVTGAGGADLSGDAIAKHKDRWQSFTKAFVANTHSMTLCDINGSQLLVRQISEDGNEIDRFSLSK